ncbi:hypothetical protein QR680_006792 [Steinernema hermaphroditum]|uniref:MD-2-related lipid-recognition domain-containing protein n=1 Tax=Steinernema hermaphroditum TaxID=289476 RepID=A0AA39LXN4_9BILA|nr:hypothetical protein QR680_006791 [Steinernema hermaphroditum]KAK0413418.1 hypothetical protein QR680_006792 [Steinernema hermaphroditum]
MALRYALLASLLALSLGCDSFPNGTDHAFHWWSCGAADGVSVSAVQPVNPDGSPQYPVRLDQDLHIAVDLINNNRIFSKLSLDVTVWTWSGLFKCGWKQIPTFGLLEDLDACDMSLTCPLKTGSGPITVKLPFSKYGIIIRLLKNNAPYQLKYELSDENGNVAYCLMAQTRALTK